MRNNVQGDGEANTCGVPRQRSALSVA